jgi:hypothetical protein
MTDQEPIPQTIFLSMPITGEEHGHFMVAIARIVGMTSAVMALQAMEHIEFEHHGKDHECSVGDILQSLGTMYDQCAEYLREHHKPVPKMATAIDEYVKKLFEDLSSEAEIEEVTRKISWLKSNKSQICDRFKEVRATPRDPNDLPLSMMLDITRHIARLSKHA